MDAERTALVRLAGLVSVPIERAVVFVVSGDPLPKERARTARGQARPRTPKRTADAEQWVAWHFHDAIKAAKPYYSGNVALLATFYRATRRVVDVDNLLKLVLDAGTKSGIWSDDSQVTTQAGIVELDRKNPRTVVVLGEYQSTLSRRT